MNIMSDSELRLEALKIAQFQMDKYIGCYLGKTLLQVSEEIYNWLIDNNGTGNSK